MLPEQLVSDMEAKALEPYLRAVNEGLTLGFTDLDVAGLVRAYQEQEPGEHVRYAFKLAAREGDDERLEVLVEDADTLRFYAAEGSPVRR